MKKLFLLILTFLTLSATARGEELRYSVGINFRQNIHTLDIDMFGNRKNLDEILESMKRNASDTSVYLRRIIVVGGASPEGSIKRNKELSERRAATLFSYLASRVNLPDSLKATTFLGRDWEGLIRRVEADTLTPYREDCLRQLYKIYTELSHDPKLEDAGLKELRTMHGGACWKYMYQHHFPPLRASKIQLWYEKHHPVPVIPDPEINLIPVTVRGFNDNLRPKYEFDTIVPEVCRPFYMAIKTNMLYDAALVPNIGAEFYLGKRWSVAANWKYSWWKTDRKHWYWRTYGGDFEIRKWFGKLSKEKPLQGHHLGAYALATTYDYETGGTGYIGGRPGGDIWDKCDWGVGLSYGYSIPVRRRLNIDFTLGVGYFAGYYYEYKPIDNCYVWQATKKHKYFGPTKAEISLVWLIGCDNVNPGKKGGRR